MVNRFTCWGIINGYQTIYYQCLLTVPSQLVKGLQHYCPIPFRRLCVRRAVLFRETGIRLVVITGCQDTGTPVSLQVLTHLFIHLFPEPSSSLPRELPHHMDKPTETLHPEADRTPPVSWFMWKKQGSLCCQEPRYFQFGGQELDKTKEKQPACLPLKGAARQHEAVCRGASPPAQFCPQRNGGTAIQQNLVHRVAEKRAEPLQPFFSFLIWEKTNKQTKSHNPPPNPFQMGNSAISFHIHEE